jgi:hypothetical protein
MLYSYNDIYDPRKSLFPSSFRMSSVIRESWYGTALCERETHKRCLDIVLSLSKDWEQRRWSFFRALVVSSNFNSSSKNLFRFLQQILKIPLVNNLSNAQARPRPLLQHRLHIGRRQHPLRIHHMLEQLSEHL